MRRVQGRQEEPEGVHQVQGQSPPQTKTALFDRNRALTTTVRASIANAHLPYYIETTGATPVSALIYSIYKFTPSSLVAYYGCVFEALPRHSRSGQPLRTMLSLVPGSPSSAAILFLPGPSAAVMFCTCPEGCRLIVVTLELQLGSWPELSLTPISTTRNLYIHANTRR